MIDHLLLGDQVVMPSPWGAGRTTAGIALDSDHEDLSVTDEEFALAKAAIQPLRGDEQAVAITSSDKSTAESVAGARPAGPSSEEHEPCT